MGSGSAHPAHFETVTESQSPDLSEALAQARLLPMFGFPTQVRTLYTRSPRIGQGRTRLIEMATSPFRSLPPALK